jgi:hypothetical protein
LFHGLVGDGSISVSISIKKFNNKVIIWSSQKFPTCVCFMKNEKYWSLKL